MSTITGARRRWTAETIDDALRGLMAELGRFPSRSELVARDQRGLWDAMRSQGGIDFWRERAAGAADPRDADPLSHERIATRAYQLYEQGQPGDAVSHWLVAEAQLTVAG